MQQPLLYTEISTGRLNSIIFVGGPVSHLETDQYRSYRINIDSIPTEVIHDFTGFSFDGVKFTRLDKSTIKQSNIDKYKEAKIASLSTTCSQLIKHGIDYNGQHYSLNDEDQLNISRLGTQAMNPQDSSKIIYHADGESCRVYTKDEMINIYNKANAWIIYNTTYFNLLKQYIESIDEYGNVLIINYNMPLPEPYASELIEFIDISEYDFNIFIIQDQYDYDNIDPIHDISDGVETYKQLEREEHEKMMRKLDEEEANMRHLTDI